MTLTSCNHSHLCSHTASFSNQPHLLLPFKNDNPEELLASYSSFCNSPINFQDKMAHKLLGENFKVEEVNSASYKNASLSLVLSLKMSCCFF